MRIGKPEKVTEEPKPVRTPIKFPEREPAREPVPEREKVPVRVGSLEEAFDTVGYEEFEARCPECGRPLYEVDTEEGLALTCPKHGGLELLSTSGFKGRL